MSFSHINRFLRRSPTGSPGNGDPPPTDRPADQPADWGPYARLPAHPLDPLASPARTASGSRPAFSALRTLLPGWRKDGPQTPQAAALEAVRHDDANRLQELLRDEPRLAQPFGPGDTLLIHAARAGRWNALQAILTHARLSDAEGGGFAALVNHQDPKGLTALAHAATKGDLRTVKSLLLHGETDVNLPDHQGRSPLWQAMEQWERHPVYGGSSTWDALLHSLVAHPGVDANGWNPQGETPLTCLCKVGSHMGPYDWGRHERWLGCTLRALLAAGRAGSQLDPEARNRAGKTPLEVAQAEGRTLLAGILREEGRQRARAAAPPEQR